MVEGAGVFAPGINKREKKDGIKSSRRGGGLFFWGHFRFFGNMNSIHR